MFRVTHLFELKKLEAIFRIQDRGINIYRLTKIDRR